MMAPRSAGIKCAVAAGRRGKCLTARMLDEPRMLCAASSLCGIERPSASATGPPRARARTTRGRAGPAGRDPAHPRARGDDSPMLLASGPRGPPPPRQAARPASRGRLLLSICPHRARGSTNYLSHLAAALALPHWKKRPRRRQQRLMRTASRTSMEAEGGVQADGGIDHNRAGRCRGPENQRRHLLARPRIAWHRRCHERSARETDTW